MGNDTDIENGKLEGDYVVQGRLQLNGMVTGTTTVSPNSHLHLIGMCCGDVIVQAGATAMLSGTIVGNLINYGVVELRGTVNGNVRSNGAHFQRAPSSVVHGTVDT